MKKIAITSHTSILVVERSDYPLTIKKLEDAQLRLKTGMYVWRRLANGYLDGHREMLIDFGDGGPTMFESRKTLISIMRHYNNVWRYRRDAPDLRDWPLDSAN